MSWFGDLSAGARRKPSPGDAQPPPAPPRESLGKVCAALEDNIEKIQRVFIYPRNQDLTLHRFLIGEVAACLVYLDGMVDKTALHRFVLVQGMGASLAGVLPGKRMEKLQSDVLALTDIEEEDALDVAVEMVLAGCSALFVEGEPTVLILETRGFEKRSVEAPVSEKVLLGPNEGFSENLRTNITLVRRIVKTPDLVCETVTVGEMTGTVCGIMYIDSLIDPQTLAELKRRIEAIQAPSLGGAGQLLQWIEDRPNALIPQILMTERPDRAASFLREGQAVVIVDGSPVILAMPATIFHMMHTPDDHFVRWQYGTLSRLVRFAGMLLSILLPGMYVAMVAFQQELLPIGLLVTIAESHSKVAFPMLTETIVMSIALELISEAGNRIPSSMGSSLSIIGALILGQAAVSASIISPMLIVVVAVTGLGGFCVPQYNLNVACRIMRYIMILAGGIAGFVGLAAASFALLIRVSALESFGVPLMAPLSPRTGGSGDRFVRMPIWRQSAMPNFYKTRPPATGGEGGTP